MLLNKVVTAVQNVVPSEYAEDVTFSRINLEGHYGNPITFFETRIKNKRAVRAFLENLSTNLSSLDKEKLGREINKHVEEGSLYLRLDKQAALQNKNTLVTSDPIRIRIRFRKSKIEDIIEICREIGMIT
jgi:RNA binding exosome subunit